MDVVNRLPVFIYSLLYISFLDTLVRQGWRNQYALDRDIGLLAAYLRLHRMVSLSTQIVPNKCFHAVTWPDSLGKI
jgi:hypothetical protein